MKSWPKPTQYRLSVLMPVFDERFLVEESIRRVLAFRDPAVVELELIAVDDGSTDGTSQVLDRLDQEIPELKLIRHPENRGKGAALRTAIKAATGDLAVVQDADLEYDPCQWSTLLRPFIEANADVVFGSRFAHSDFRRVLYFWHHTGNRLITTLANAASDLNLTDVETCYKMVRLELLRSIPLRSDDFAVEVELAVKLAKRGAVIYEVPISYSGRTYMEGKKITWRDGLRAVAAIARWRIIDDIYTKDAYGAEILTSMSHVHRFNRWMADTLLPNVGERVLEIGAGLGNLTIHMIPRARYLATDINDHYLAYLRNFALARPYLEVARLDVQRREDFEGLEGQFDTVICLNVLEHVPDPSGALANIYSALAPGGRALILVPQGPFLYSTLDDEVGHEKRYSRLDLTAELNGAGFVVQELFDFNHIGTPSWLINGKLLKRRHFSHIQLGVLNLITPLVRRVDDKALWPGLSLVAVCQRPDVNEPPPRQG